MSHRPTFSTAVLVCLRLSIITTLVLAAFGLPAPAEAAAYVVNSRADETDGVCDYEHCTLREAITAANVHPGPDTIWFNFESGSPYFVIYLDDELPVISDTGTTIDGSTMPRFEGNPSVVLVGDEDIEYGLFLERTGTTVRGLGFSSFTGGDEAAAIYVQGSGNLIEDNAFHANTTGILIRGSETTVRRNLVGVRALGSAAPNTGNGIRIASNNNLLTENTIAYNGGAGILVAPDHDFTGNTFTRNSIHDNGALGIEIGENNAGVDTPYLTSRSVSEVSGEACRDCLIELFLAAPDPTDYGEGMTFLGETSTGSSREFTFAFDDPLDRCDPITATATDPSGNTSEFSLNVTAPDCLRATLPPLTEPYLTVNTEDDLDDGICDAEHCSLREAINQANSHLGADMISFDIPDPTPHSIELVRRLPHLTDDRTTIDGTTEPDFGPNPSVILSGRNGISVGLEVDSQRNTIRGLSFIYFGSVDYSDGWYEVSGSAIVLQGGFNRIENNKIYLNDAHGVDVRSNHNLITGNKFGALGEGLADWPNAGHGITVSGDFNTIGGNGPGEGNQIAASGLHGINVYNSEGNRIFGNIIGGDASGEVAIPNHGSGIFSQGVLEIGGLDPGEGNIIIGNDAQGVYLYDTARDSFIAGNTIRENGEFGILVEDDDDAIHTFTRNSIFANGDLGIKTNRTEDHIPRIEHASLTEISGFACRGCLVELFLADPDPTGYGEGKTFLGEARADIGGAWSVAISGVSSCDDVTATATKSGVGTSEFAENKPVNCLRMSGAPMAAAIGISVLIFVGIILMVQALRPETPPWWLPAGAASGLVLSLLFIGILVLSHRVRLDLTRRPPIPDPIPACEQYIDPKTISPADDSIFELDQDPLLSWIAGQDLPDGEIIWEIIVRLPDQTLASVVTAEPSLRLSALGVDPRPGGVYGWRVNAATRADQAEEDVRFCRGEEEHTFTFVNPLLAEAAPAETELVEPSPAPEEQAACDPQVTAMMNATCRFGPDSAFHELGYLLQGEMAPAQAQTQGGGWYQVLLGNNVTCWVWSGAVEPVCTGELPVDPGPEPPTQVPAPADETPPPAPKTLAPKNGESIACVASVALSWSTVDDPSGISSYNIQAERSPDQSSWSSAPGSPWSTGGTGQSIPVECGFYYRWRVRAVDSAGNTGTYSPWSAFTVPLQ